MNPEYSRIIQNWRVENFGTAPLEIIDGDRGRNYPKNNEFTTDGYCLFLTANNVTSNGFSFNNSLFISQEKDEKLRQGRVVRGDIILTTRGTLGNVGFYSNSIIYEHLRINSGMVIVRVDKKQFVPEFVYYYLRSPGFNKQVNSLKSGAAQPQLPVRDIKRITIPIPPIDTQRRIASILSAYDDLIENNNRRIALLEESMRLLYREWFVRLRFPGHEHVRVVDGLPEGWERKTLGDVIVLNYGKGLKEETRIDGGIPVYGSSGIVGYHNEALVSGPAIIVGRKGNVGSVYWSAVDCFPIDTVYFITSEQATPFIYLNLQHQHFVSSDVAVPGLNRNHAYAQQILIPSQKLLNQFNEIIDTIIREIEILKTSSTKLSEARDLLLPRLMSGEIDVS